MLLFLDAVSTTIAGIPIHSFPKTQSKHSEEIQIVKFIISIIRSSILLCDLVVITMRSCWITAKIGSEISLKIIDMG